MQTNSSVSVYVKYTQASGPTPANIQFFTDSNGDTTWQPDSLAFNSQTTYYFGFHEDSDKFGWYGLSFWPEANGSTLSNVVESYVFPSSGGEVHFQSTLYVQSIILKSWAPPPGKPPGPSFCVCNNNQTSDTKDVGMQLTICPHFSGKPSSYYLTSNDPKIPLMPSG